MGGQVVPGAATLLKSCHKTVMDNLQIIMPHGIIIYPVGSAGYKEYSSDVDVLIDADELMLATNTQDIKSGRIALEQYFLKLELFAARSGVSIHVGIPTGRVNEIVQVDIMAVKNAQAVIPLHTHDYSLDPEMKGGTIHAIWADLANLSSFDKFHIMMSPYQGLMFRDPITRKPTGFITCDKDKIASILIGPTASAQDMGSVHAIVSALSLYPDKFQFIKTKYYPTFTE